MEFLKNNWTYIAGGILGALGGYLYWLYIGCETGTCPITASPTNSTLYGVLLGALFGGMFKRSKKIKQEKHNPDNK